MHVASNARAHPRAGFSPTIAKCFSAPAHLGDFRQSIWLSGMILCAIYGALVIGAQLVVWVAAVQQARRCSRAGHGPQGESAWCRGGLGTELHPSEANSPARLRLSRLCSRHEPSGMPSPGCLLLWIAADDCYLQAGSFRARKTIQSRGKSRVLRSRMTRRRACEDMISSSGIGLF